MIAAKKYNISIYESMGDYIHDNPTIITDFYIPSVNITFNYHNKVLNVFKDCRMDDGTHIDDVMNVELPQALVDNVICILSKKNEIEILSKNIIHFIKQ